MSRSIFVALFSLWVGHVVSSKLQLLGLEHERIQGEYLIEYHDDAQSVQMFEDHLKNWEAHFASEPLNLAPALGFHWLHAKLTGEELAKVENFTAVKTISHDRIMKKLQDGVQQNPIPSLDRIDQQSGRDGTYEYLHDGTGVDIFVLDTGCDIGHPGWASDDANKISYLADCTNPGPACVTNLNRTPLDVDTHGTHVSGSAASEVYGVAKGARVRCVKVLGDDGSGSINGIINGINVVVAARNNENNARPGVINMSLGGGSSNNLNRAATAASDAGTVVVVAAGNSAEDAAGSSPASADRIITVGSSTRDDVVSSFSNTGSVVDIFAVGSTVTSLRANSDGLLTISGTSMASPHVAGACAQLLGADPSRTPADILELITSTAVQGALTAPQGAAAGTPNLLLNVQNEAFGGPLGDGTVPATTTATDAEPVTQAPVPDSANCLSLVDEIDNQDSSLLSRARGMMLDIFPLANALEDGRAPMLESIIFYSSDEFTDANPGTALVYARNGGYRTDGATTNADQWDLIQSNGQAEVRIVSSGTETISGVNLFTNVVVLPSTRELMVNSRNGIYLTIANFDMIFQQQDESANQAVATDGVVLVAAGRVIGAPFSTSAIEGRLPLVNLCYSQTTQSQATGADSSLSTSAVSMSDSLECVENIVEGEDVQNTQNGVMFDLISSDLASADGVWLESFSVFLMDSMAAGEAEVWTTRNGESYEGQENDESLWTLVGSVDSLDYGLSEGEDGTIVVDDDAEIDDDDEDGMSAPEAISVPELMDLDFGLNLQLRGDNTAQGFYVTFKEDQMGYYDEAQDESTIVATNDYVSMTGGKGVEYPFGGTSEMIFDMRQFAGQACFSTSDTRSTDSGAPSVVTTPLTIVVGVVASVLLAIFH